MGLAVPLIRGTMRVLVYNIKQTYQTKNRPRSRQFGSKLLHDVLSARAHRLRLEILKCFSCSPNIPQHSRGPYDVQVAKSQLSQSRPV